MIFLIKNYPLFYTAEEDKKEEAKYKIKINLNK